MEGAQRDFMPLVTSCNGKAPARSSRAAREWYSRRVSWDPSTRWAPLCPPLCGFFSVHANFTKAIYHQMPALSSGKDRKEGRAKNEINSLFTMGTRFSLIYQV